MPSFIFEIVDGYKLEDPSDMELPTEQAAKKVAHEIANQISNDVDDEGLTDVVVKTDGGEAPINPIEALETRLRPLELRRSPLVGILGRGRGAGEGNRTLVFSLEGCCSTIELHPRWR